MNIRLSEKTVSYIVLGVVIFFLTKAAASISVEFLKSTDDRPIFMIPEMQNQKVRPNLWANEN